MNKLIQWIGFGVLLTIAIFSFIYGFRVDSFLAFSIISILLYLNSTIKIEKFIYSKTFVLKFDGANLISLQRKYFKDKNIISASLLLIFIYLISIFCIKSIQQPSGKNPYFTNINHHALSNSGVGFNKELYLYHNNASLGLYKCDTGYIKALSNGANINIESTQFYEPFFVNNIKELFTPYNNIYNEPINDNFKISDGKTTLKIINIKKVNNYLNKLLGNQKNNYSIQFAFNTNDTTFLQPYNLKGFYSDTFSYTGPLNKGISFKEFFVKSNEKISDVKGITTELSQIFEKCYILANYKNESSYLTFFPSQNFLEKNFNVYSNEKLVQANLNTSFGIQKNQKFYIGLKNIKYANCFQNTDVNYNQKFATTLVFDYAPFKYFTSPIADIKIGTLHQNFVLNHYSQLLQSNSNEGFLMHDEMNANELNYINGKINFSDGKPNTNLQLQVIDENNNQSNVLKSDSKNFDLLSKNKMILWQFKITNFAKNSYDFNHQFIYISILFLLFLLTILFNAGKNSERIEPIIFAVWLCLFVIRHILLWRISSFPPVNAISKFELNSMINFDTSINFLFNLPFAFASSIITIVILNIYRKWGKILSKYTLQLFALNKSRFLLFHILFLIICFLVFKFLPVENIKRISTILFPLASYFWFSFKILSAQDQQYNHIQNNIKNKVVNYIYEFYKYWVETTHFLLSATTFLFLITTDRGFAVLFLLFLFIKNVIFSFLRGNFLPAGIKLKELIYKPKYYWIYSILFFIIYLFVIGFKSTFYYLLQYKLYIILFICIIFIGTLINIGLYNLYRKIFLGIAIIFSIILIVPASHHYVNNKINHSLRFVSYRASVIFQPIDKLISNETYNSFEEDKIIETAQNQWFINAYINKDIDYKQPLNIRNHFNRGVDYITQTRDLVLPRYLIAEMGNVTVILILILLLLPIVIFLLFYGVTDKGKRNFIPANSAVATSLMLLFTIAIFVWLTSTNRFVFFGQDFPFLSLTSRVSILLPLLIFYITLSNNPLPKLLTELNVANRLKRFYIFGSITLLAIIISGKSNQLNNEIFSINLNDTEVLINNKMNTILTIVQEKRKSKITATNLDNEILESNQFETQMKKVIAELISDSSYNNLYSNASNYSKSLLDVLKNNPSSALQANSPIYLRYDNGIFQTEYNQNIYLELPAYESNEKWAGNIYAANNTNIDKVELLVNNKPISVSKLPEVIVLNGAKMAIIPRNWLSKSDTNNVLLTATNIGNTVKERPQIQIMKQKLNSTKILNASSFTEAIHISDKAIIKTKDNQTLIAFENMNANIYVKNIWVNGNRRMIYPAGENLFWMHHYANTASFAFSKAKKINQQTAITLDFDLQNNANKLLHIELPKLYGNRKNFKYSIIAADGLGNIKLMADFANNRIILNPNDERAINELSRKNYFFSNKSNERDQWGNANLLNMTLGPGSSIKPIIAAAAATSGVTDWDKLELQSNNNFAQKFKEKFPTTYTYAGYDLIDKGWSEQHNGDNSNCDFNKYLATSNNFYHSVIMFMGSYPISDFIDSAKKISVKNKLVAQSTDKKNTYPLVKYNNETVALALPSFNNNAWPKTANDIKQYFGNDNGIIAKGLSSQFNLKTNDQDKNDFKLKTNSRISFAEKLIFDTLKNNPVSSYLWSFPEESFFIQRERSHKEMGNNFVLGIKTPTAGGYPFEVSPIKMVELYGRLFTMSHYKTSVTQVDTITPLNFNLDSIPYINFLKNSVFEGMKQVLTVGTARDLASTLGLKNNKLGEYFLYAKTGTINEGSNIYDSKKLALIISKYDMKIKGTHNKIYIIYINANNIDKPNNLLNKKLIDMVLNSISFKNYMNN